MYDREMALESIMIIGIAGGDVSVLTDEERHNLLALVKDFCRQQGWDTEQLLQEG
uniref:Uncharacterized protein n=1 Tax=viral metagenome TaxID=1070528 RepID=A0A6M3JNG1_9ZZZZ